MENKIVVAVKGIINYKGRILIIKRSENDGIGAGIWEFPGGKIKFGETLETALSREVKEETGLSVTIEKLLYAGTFKTHENRQTVILSYRCSAGSDGVTLSREHQSFLWADREQAEKMLSKPIIDDLNRSSVWECIF